MPNRHYPADPDLATFVASIPKTETHLHLEGSVSFEQLHAFDPERYPEPPPFWDPGYRFDGFMHFQSMFDHWIIPYHTSADHYQRTARHVFAECRRRGCRYVETSVHLPAIARIDVDGPELLAAILEVVPPGLEVRLFGGMTHLDHAEHAALLERALGWEDLCGIDLHGPEDWPVHEAVPDYWARARAAGKKTKAHAGEFMDASFVDWVLDNLAPERIQHGVRAIESADVVDKLVEREVVLDVCPISNVKLGVQGIGHMGEHPIRELIDAGVCVTLNTDDTFLFGNNLEEEYIALAVDLGFSRSELLEVARNGGPAPPRSTSGHGARSSTISTRWQPPRGPECHALLGATNSSIPGRMAAGRQAASAARLVTPLRTATNCTPAARAHSASTTESPTYVVASASIAAAAIAANRPSGSGLKRVTHSPPTTWSTSGLRPSRSSACSIRRLNLVETIDR